MTTTLNKTLQELDHALQQLHQANRNLKLALIGFTVALAGFIMALTHHTTIATILASAAIGWITLHILNMLQHK